MATEQELREPERFRTWWANYDHEGLSLEDIATDAYWQGVESARSTTSDYRRGVEDALKAVDVCSCGSGPEFRPVDQRYHLASCSKNIATMARALLTTEDTAWACVWEEAEDGVWQTSCGNEWQFEEGGPSDNGQEYCGYCGKPLSELQLFALPAPPDAVVDEKESK